MKVKTITFTLDARFDAEGIARGLQREWPLLIAFIVSESFDVKSLKTQEMIDAEVEK